MIVVLGSGSYHHAGPISCGRCINFLDRGGKIQNVKTPVQFFRQIAEAEGISPEGAEKIVSDYLALAQGEPWTTGERKKGIIDALYTPLEKHPDLQPDYRKAFQVDGFAAVREILDAGEHVLIFSSKVPKGFKEILPEDIAHRIQLYEGVKVRPEAYEKLSQDELKFGHRLVSHTADELPELEAAVKSGIFSNNQGRLVFIKRNEQVSDAAARSAGIDFYVSDLKMVGYSRLVKREQP